MSSVWSAVARMALRQAQLGARGVARVAATPVHGRFEKLASNTQSRFYSGAAPPTVAEASAKILSILETNSKISPSKLRMDADFINDLGLDSLDLVECVMFVEDEFGIQMSDDQALEIRCPKDLLAYIPTSDGHGHGHGHGDHHADPHHH